MRIIVGNDHDNALYEKCIAVQKGWAERGGGLRGNDADFKARY